MTARLDVRLCGVTTARVGVARVHRHRRRSVGAIVGLEVVAANWPVGWALVGRAVAPKLAALGVKEVTRCATDGTPNACSALYGFAARIARRKGWPILTYTLESEGGASLRGAGWEPCGTVTPSGRGWNSRDNRAPTDMSVKVRWIPAWLAAQARGAGREISAAFGVRA